MSSTVNPISPSRFLISSSGFITTLSQLPNSVPRNVASGSAMCFRCIPESIMMCCPSSVSIRYPTIGVRTTFPTSLPGVSTLPLSMSQWPRSIKYSFISRPPCLESSARYRRHSPGSSASVSPSLRELTARITSVIAAPGAVLTRHPTLSHSRPAARSAPHPGGRRLHAQSEEVECCRNHDRPSERRCRKEDHLRPDVGQDMTNQQTGWTAAHDLSGNHIFALPD